MYLAKEYQPVALLNVTSRVIEGVVKEKLSYILEA